MQEKLRALEERFESLTLAMARPEAAADYQKLQALAKERASLEEVVQLHRALRKVEAQIDDARALASDGADAELARLARDELAMLDPGRERPERELRRARLPAAPHDERDVIVETRAGAGGEEASLFAADLYRMYARYADHHGWQTEALSSNETGIGGFKEIIFEVRGRGADSRLKRESGVHRVQRVPQTEDQGRIHTSTATVAVLHEE